LSDGTTTTRADYAWTYLSAQLRFWIPAVAILVLDLWSKSAVFAALKPDETRSIIDGTLEFRRSLNDGAVFGSFTGMTTVFVVASLLALGFVVYLFKRSYRFQWLMQIALGLILAGAIGNLYDRVFVKADVVVVTTDDHHEHSIIGVLLSEPDADVVRLGAWPGGDEPRTFDRKQVQLRRQGVVRDFIKFVPRFPNWFPRLGGMDMWPWVFNTADASLVVGVIVLLFHGLLERPPRQTGEETSTQ